MPVKEKSVNIILACEIIEHLPKSKGKMFLNALEKISTDKIIVSTPNFRYLQDKARRDTLILRYLLKMLIVLEYSANFPS